MAKILDKKLVSPAVYELVIEAPLIARKCKPGQFVIVLSDPESERVPFTIADFDREKGTITMIIQVVGNTSRHICEDFEAGDEWDNIVGPLGQPSEMKNFGTVVGVGGGIGVAPVYPIARAYKEMGNKVISIIGARNKDLVLWEDRMRTVSDELIVCTDDGSFGCSRLLGPNEVGQVEQIVEALHHLHVRVQIDAPLVIERIESDIVGRKSIFLCCHCLFHEWYTVEIETVAIP